MPGDGGEADRKVIHGWSFPGDLDVPEELGQAWHKFKIGGNEIKGLSALRHIDLVHQRRGVIDTEIVHAGFSEGGLLHVGAKVTVIIDGDRYSAVQGADSASTKVKEPGYTYAVAETRALKRAVKKALNIYPVDGATSEFIEEEAVSDSGTPPSVPPGGGPGGGPDGTTTVTPAPSERPSVDVGDDEPEW